MTSLLFSAFCYLILFGSILLILGNLTPISQILLLIGIFISASFIYLLMDFYFIGFTYIIVYVGAIAILFLFVLMMIDLAPNPVSHSYLIPFLAFLLLMGFGFNNIEEYTYYYSDWYIIWDNLRDIQSIGRFLYFGYPFALILLAITLWGVMIGIISIVTK